MASARLAARLSGRRVEALSERSETTTTWANPDGSSNSELAAGPTRFKRADQWLDIDETLVRRSDGGVAARAHPGELRLGKAGGARASSLAAARGAAARPLVSLTTEGRSIGLGWRGGLPEPVLDGQRATYPDVVPGSDLVIESRPTGFEQFLVVRQRPAAGADMSFTLPLSAPGLKAEQQKDGGVMFADAASGRDLALMPAPVMWDAATDPATGDHLRKAPVRMDVVTRGSTVELLVTPDAGFLADPATAYPVTVDPSTTTLGAVLDTWVQSGSTADLSTSSEMRVGPETTNGAINRSLMSWNTAPIAGALVTSATLNLYNFSSGACSRGWQVHSTALASASTLWTTQPVWYTSPAPVTTTASKGAPCATAAGWVTADVTPIVAAWASTAAATSGMGLRASSETDATYRKRFYSANFSAANAPRLAVTYNYRPLDSTNLQAGPPFFATGGTYAVSTTTPTLRATTGDRNNDSVRATFQVFDGATQVASVNSAFVPAGQVASATIPAGSLVNGKTYTFTVTCYDGTHWETTSAGPVSFVVDTTRPSAPNGLSSTDYPSSAWVKGVGQAGTFTVTPPVGGDHQWIEWSLDGTQWTKVATGGAATAKTFSVTPPRNGTQVLQVRAVDKADNRSDAVSYTFHAGPGGFNSPVDGQRTARRVSLAAEADAAKYNSVSFSWRRSETDAWTAIPPTQVTSGGTALTAWPVPMTAGKNAPLAWTATDTVNPDGTVQVKATFTGPGGTGGTDPVTVVVDRSADGAATDDVGPGSVNLLTGDYTLSGTEASMFGMSVSRTASSRAPTAGTAQAGQVAIFGPQWVSGIEAEDTESDYAFIRQTSPTSLDVVDSEDEATHFTAKTGGGWVPEPGAEDLTLTGTFGGTFTLSDTGGTVTTFGKVAPAATTWPVTSSLLDGLTNATTTTVSEAVAVGGATLSRPKRIVAPTSAVTVAACQADPSTKGCRVLEFTYATATTAAGSTFGDYAGQVSAIQVWATTPGAVASTPTVVTRYAYDVSGRAPRGLGPPDQPGAEGRVRLRRRWPGHHHDPARAPSVDVHLRPRRGSGDRGRRDAGQGHPADPDAGQRHGHQRHRGHVSRLRRAAVRQHRSAPAGGEHRRRLGADGRPDRRHRRVPGRRRAGRAQRQRPHRNLLRPGVPVLLGRLRPDRQHRRPGREHHHHRVRHLRQHRSRADRRQPGAALGTTGADTAELAALGIGGLPPAERAEQLSTRSIYNDTGTWELEELAPLHEVTLEANLLSGATTVAPAGARVVARARTVNEYDAGRPTDGTAVVRDQVTRSTVGAQLRLRPDLLADARASTTAYDWAKGVATATVQDPGGLAITTTTEYDAQGRVTKTVPPGSTGTDAAALITTYYTAAGTSPCGGRPEWADQVCQAAPAGAITGGGTNPTQAVTTTTEYGRYGATTTVTETANGVTRTTTTGYDAADRPTSATVTGGVGAAVPAVTTGYDPATGQATTVSSSAGGTITTGYDALGRPRTYTDADGAATTTSYDALDRPTTVTDTVPSDRHLHLRHRRRTARPGDVDGRFGGGDVPGDVRPRRVGGQRAARRLHRHPDRGSHRVTDRADVHPRLRRRGRLRGRGGRVRARAVAHPHRHPGSGVRAGLHLRQGWPADRGGGRHRRHLHTPHLRVQRSIEPADPVHGDQRAGSGGVPDDRGDHDHPHLRLGRPDHRRRLRLRRFRPHHHVAGSGDHRLPHDRRGSAADRRHRPDQLDASMRPRGWTSESNASGTWTATATRLNHYDSAGDEPKWTVENTGTAAITRNVESLSGDLAATTATSSGTVLQLTNLHGDVALQLPVDTAVAPTVLAADEYGNVRPGTPAARYGWLGAKQRSAETPTSMILMGVRVYNPTTGRFLQTDPEPGGSCSDYDYVCADPVNAYDLDGRKCWRCKFRSAARWVGRHKVDIAMTAVSFVPGVGQAVWAYRGYRVARAVHQGIRMAKRERFARQMWNSRQFGHSSKLFGRKWTIKKTKIKGGRKGVLNRNNYFRVGWGYNGGLGRNVFRLAIFKRGSRFHYHRDLF